MANLPESSTFDAGVYQLETTDPVIGGPSGVSNTPLKNLANRTKYLKDHVDAIEAAYAPKASPAFTGTPTAPTAAAGTNTTQLATTAFVQTAMGSVDLSNYAPKASPSFSGTPTAPTPTTGDNSTKLATTAFVNAEIAADTANLAPSGAVQFFARNTAPSGWLKCNGAAISRTTYAALFAAIGTAFGAGDGVNTFNLPDLRGEFIRGWDDSRGVDASRAFGTAQADQFQGHGHDLIYPYTGAFGTGNLQTALNTSNVSGVLSNYAADPISLPAYGNARFGAETRPRNVALLPCIKF